MHATTATPLAGGRGRSTLSKPSAYSALFCKSSSVTVTIASPSTRLIESSVLEHRRESPATASTGEARYVAARCPIDRATPGHCYRGGRGTTTAGPAPPAHPGSAAEKVLLSVRGLQAPRISPERGLG